MVKNAQGADHAVAKVDDHFAGYRFGCFATYDSGICIGHRLVKSLADVVPGSDQAFPKVSVIVAACNEQRNMRDALQSLLNLSP